MDELINVLQGTKALLGFKSTTIAAAYLGAPLACLICVLYGLIRWNQGQRMHLPNPVGWVRQGTQRLLTVRLAGMSRARRQRRVGKRRRRPRRLLRSRISGR